MIGPGMTFFLLEKFIIFSKICNLFEQLWCMVVEMTLFASPLSLGDQEDFPMFRKMDLDWEFYLYSFSSEIRIRKI